jgi:DNA repair exonuclease SbcCD ATPase subunit
MEKKTVIIEVQTEDGVKQLDRLSAKFDEVYGDVLPLTASIGELEDQLYQMALEGKRGTEEFNLLAQEAGRLKKTLQQVDLEVDGLSMTTANKLGGALGGVTAGFELVQGAMGAMGAESEKVQEALLKVQSAMAMAQGVQGLKESAASFKALGQSAATAFQGMSSGAKVFAATGIGLLITAVGYLVSNFETLKDSFSGVSAEQKALNSTMGDYKKGAEDAITETNNVKVAFDLARDGVISKEQALETYNDTLGDSFGQAKNLNEAEKLFRDKTDSYIQATALRAQANALLTLAAQESAKALTSQMEDQRTLGDDIKVGVVQALGFAGATADIGKKQQEQRRAEAKKTAEANAKIFQQEAENLLKQAANVEKSNKIKSEADIKYDAEAAQRRKDAAAKAKEARDKAIEDKYAQNAAELEAYKRRLEEERAMQEAEDAWKLEQETLAKTEQEAKYEKERADEEAASAYKIELWEREAAEAKRLEDEKTAKRKQAIDTSIELTQKSLSVIGDLVDAFVGKDTASQKKAFKIKKAASIASAVIDTYKGAQSAYADTPGGVILKTVAAGIAVASGLAKVKAISNTQFEGGGGSASAGGGGASGAPSLPASNPAQFNIVGNSGTNQLNGLGGGTMKAYVVSGDVTSAQSLERNKITTATL